MNINIPSQVNKREESKNFVSKEKKVLSIRDLASFLSLRSKKSKLGSDTGSMTIEAALALSIFLFLCMVFLYFIQALRIQLITQHALDQACLEASSHISHFELVTKQVDKYEEVIDEIFTGKLAEYKNFSREEVDLAKNEISSLVSTLGVDRTFGALYVSSIFDNYVYGENSGFQGLIDKGLVSNMAWSTRTEEDMLYLELSYSMKQPFLSQVFPPLYVEQKSATGLWHLPGVEKLAFDEGTSDDEDASQRSIWQETPFERGRYFADSFRESRHGYAIETGKGFDMYEEPNTLTEVFSLNIFSKSYASGQGVDPGAYELKKSPIKSQIKSRVRKMIENYEKHDYYDLEDGRRLDKKDGMDLKLLMVLPEEAKAKESIIEEICKELESEYGVEIEIIYREKALIQEEGDE